MTIQTKFLRQIAFAAFALVLLTVAARAQVASNPPFTLEQSVIGGGGGTSADTGGAFTVTGIVGQPIAGRNQTGSTFSVRSGFFTPLPVAPTAASVSIGGRVLTADGRGIRNARVTLTDMNGETRYATTGAFGYYSFADAAVGETYILQVTAKRFRFSNSTRVVNLTDELTDADFVADQSEGKRFPIQ